MGFLTYLTAHDVLSQQGESPIIHVNGSSPVEGPALTNSWAHEEKPSQDISLEVLLLRLVLLPDHRMTRQVLHKHTAKLLSITIKGHRQPLLIELTQGGQEMLDIRPSTPESGDDQSLLLDIGDGLHDGRDQGTMGPNLHHHLRRRLRSKDVLNGRLPQDGLTDIAAPVIGIRVGEGLASDTGHHRDAPGGRKLVQETEALSTSGMRQTWGGRVSKMRNEPNHIMSEGS